jgi:hypothetical protein
VSVLKTTTIVENEKKCPNTSISICESIIEAQDGSSSNVVDGNTFKLTCDEDLAPPGKHDVVPKLPDDSGDNDVPAPTAPAPVKSNFIKKHEIEIMLIVLAVTLIIATLVLTM